MAPRRRSRRAEGLFDLPGASRQPRGTDLGASDAEPYAAGSMGAASNEDGVPAWLYLVGAAAILIVLVFLPGVLDWVSGLFSDQIVDGINEMQSTTTTTVP